MADTDYDRLSVWLGKDQEYSRYVCKGVLCELIFGTVELNIKLLKGCVEIKVNLTIDDNNTI